MSYEKTISGRQNNNFEIISNLKNCSLSDNNKNYKRCDLGIKIIKKKNFLWDHQKWEIKQNTLRNDCKDGSLKTVDIEDKIAGSKRFWVKQLYTENHHEWKIIPLLYINNKLFKKFKFHSNLNILKSTQAYIPIFVEERSIETLEKILFKPTFSTSNHASPSIFVV